MTIKDLAELLAKQGHDITLRTRSDGGYIISKIDGVSFKGASGNIQARRIAGVQLSHARTIQLARIKPPKRIAPMSRKKAPLPEELVKKLRKVQREWRKKHPDISGSASMKGLRYYYETYGEEQAMASLDKHYRYAQGFAYIDNVNHLIERLEQTKVKADIYGDDTSIIDRIINTIKNNVLSFREDWINPTYEAIYDYEHGNMPLEELERRIAGIMA